MIIPDPDFYPGFNNSNKRGGGNKFVLLVFVASNFTDFADLDLYQFQANEKS
jgi:hypothetical protein